MSLPGRLLLFLLFGVLLSAMPLAAEPYSVRKTVSGGVPVVELADPAHQTSVSVAPSLGNIAYEMMVRGKNAFWFPFESLGDFAEKPSMCGNPFLAPWANRLDQDSFFANGKKYKLNAELGNVSRDPNGLPIHGLLRFSPHWEVVELDADAGHARAVSVLEFSRYPDLMAQFPFAHTVEMSYILRDGVLEVKTAVHNTGSEPMPLVIGYHPYFQIHDAPREQWSVSLGAERVWKLNGVLTPTGETATATDVVPSRGPFALGNLSLDHVFGGLVRDSSGLASFSVQGKRQKIEVMHGPKFNTAVVYAPAKSRAAFICFEPMTGVTNGFNLAHRDAYENLQVVPAGESWEESFWIRPSGF